MSSFLSSLNLSPFTLVGVGLVILAVAIVLLVVWVIALDRRTRGVVDGLEVERRKVAEMQVIVSQRVARGGGPRSQGRPAPGSWGAAGAPAPGAGRAPEGARAQNPGAARAQNPGAARVGIPQNAEMGSQRVRAAQPASQARTGAGAAGAAPASEEEQVFAAWVQERAQAMGQAGRSRAARGRSAAAAAAGGPGVPGAATGAGVGVGAGAGAGAPQGSRQRAGRSAREAHDPHAFNVPRGVDKTGGVPMEQWTGPVGRPRDGRRGQVARQATAAAQAQAARGRGVQAQAQAASSRERVEEAARAQRAAAQAQRRSAEAVRDARACAGAGAAGTGAPAGASVQGNPRAQARSRAGAGAGAGAGSRAAAGARARGGAQAAAAQQEPRQGRVAGESRPWQNPRANARQATQAHAARGGNPRSSGYVQVDAAASRQPHSYAQGASSPLQPRDGRRPMTQPHSARPVDDAPIPVQVEAASSTGLFRRKKNAEPARGKHAR